MLTFDPGVLYLTLPLLHDAGQARSPEDLLRPYLDATLTPSQTTEDKTPQPNQPLFTVFYKQHPVLSTASSVNEDAAPLLSLPSDSIHLPEIGDLMVGSAEITFWKAIEQLKMAGRKPQRKEKEGEQEGAQDIDSFWPPLEVVDDESEEW